jgi:sugar-specific transcriptional regulator TrmB
MDELPNRKQAIESLQQLGLKEYEAKAFVALSRIPKGTAKDVSEVSDVPRTRVYDAIRVLETKGLVEIQHSSPQQFRAVSIDEAVDTLRREYEERAESLRRTLRDLEQVSAEEGTEVTYEVWSLSGTQAMANRTRQLVEDADREVVLVLGAEGAFDEDLRDGLRAARERECTVIVGTVSEALRGHVEGALPETEVFVSGLEWLGRSTLPDDETEISRMLLVDREAILVSTVHESVDGGTRHEHGVFGRGFDNGFVAVVRRMMATGLLASDDPGNG